MREERLSVPAARAGSNGWSRCLVRGDWRRWLERITAIRQRTEEPAGDPPLPWGVLPGNPPWRTWCNLRTPSSVAARRPGPCPLDADVISCSWGPPDGRWWVVSDRTQAPSGMGYALENRIVSSRTMPAAFKQIPVERVAHFFARLQNSIRRRAPRPGDNPRIVLLSSGPGHPYYFEDVELGLSAWRANPCYNGSAEGGN